MGTPTTLIQNGKILEKNLKKVRYDINDMLEQCRIKGFYDVSNISYAILEVNGELSILPKKEYRVVNTSDLKLNVVNEGLCANVIIDGKIMHRNLSEINKEESWLNDKLIELGVGINDVILGTIDVNGKLNVYERNKNVKILDVLE